MEERLVVKNFGPIKDIDIRIGKLTVLIGEQATGKSTLGKLLSVCRYFSYIVDNPRDFTPAFEIGLQDRQLDEYIEDGKSQIQYWCEHYTLSAFHVVENYFDPQTGEVDGQIAEFKVNLEARSDAFKYLLTELEAIKPKFKGVISSRIFNWQIPTIFLQNEVAQVMSNPFYLPAERGLQSIFSLGRNSIQNISDSLFNVFAKLDQIAKNFSDNLDVQPLGIEYMNHNGIGYFRKIGSQQYHKMQNAASGYQSVVPIVLLVEYYTQIRKKKKTFIIEEPELNLFPTTQHRLMQYLVSNLNQTENQILITTHSPYVLSSLNVLMNAWQAGAIAPEAAAKIIPKAFWLDPKDVSAYMLKDNGHCENIMDVEEGMIKSEKIDEASEILNQKFDALLNLQFGIEDESA